MIQQIQHNTFSYKTINNAMAQNHINSFSIINGSQLCEMVFERQFTKVKQQVKILNHI